MVPTSALQRARPEPRRAAHRFDVGLAARRGKLLERRAGHTNLKLVGPTAHHTFCVSRSARRAAVAAAEAHASGAALRYAHGLGRGVARCARHVSEARRFRVRPPAHYGGPTRSAFEALGRGRRGAGSCAGGARLQRLGGVAREVRGRGQNDAKAAEARLRRQAGQQQGAAAAGQLASALACRRVRTQSSAEPSSPSAADASPVCAAMKRKYALTDIGKALRICIMYAASLDDAAAGAQQPRIAPASFSERDDLAQPRCFRQRRRPKTTPRAAGRRGTSRSAARSAPGWRPRRCGAARGTRARLCAGCWMPSSTLLPKSWSSACAAAPARATPAAARRAVRRRVVVPSLAFVHTVTTLRPRQPLRA